MGTSNSKPTGQRPTESAPPETSTPPASYARPAGRIVHDARGNAVWNWAGSDTARVAVESTSTMLKRLELPGLKVEGQDDKAEAPTVEVSVAQGQSRDARSPDITGGGYNPYDQRRAVRKPTAPKAPVKTRPPRA